MKKLIYLIFIISLLASQFSMAQLSGKVSEFSEHQKLEPIIGANVYWAGTTIGTITGKDGAFTINKPANKSTKLVISFVGYKNDTVEVKRKKDNLHIVLTSSNELNEVVVNEHLGGAYISTIQPLKTEVITNHGLQKLACCNLSESFENSATIDVGYSDAVSGAKQIKMLGLAGVYSQLLTENIPSIRGLATAYGLNYVPGSWMESIQISKGTASVINGYESITGQINIELKKPQKSEKLFVNLYGNSKLKSEANINAAIKINEKWSTMLLLHGSRFNNPFDHNGDGFIDKPLLSQYNIINRWSYETEKMHSQFGINMLQESRQGGQKAYFDAEDNSGLYGIDVDTRRAQLFAKTGFRFHRPATSLGLMASYSFHEQDSYYGNNRYDANQNSIYANAIFQSYIGNTNHKYSTGISYQYDDYQEQLNHTSFDRTESVPGVFAQYTYSLPEKVSVIAGIRSDFNSKYGTLLTPRLHFKYHLNHQTTLRASAGKGYRSANTFIEHTGILASSRSFVFHEDFNIEEAWNYGVNITRKFHLKKHNEITFTADFYRTDFVNQVIVDTEKSSREVHFYNLNGKSYSNSFQTEVSAKLLGQMEIIAAFRFNDVKTTINDKLMEKPLVNRYKGLLSASWFTRYKKWQIDVTGQLNGQKRLPETSNNPVHYQKDTFSPNYFILHAQLTRRFKHFELYAGGENLTDFTQDDPIIAPDNPFGDYFDASMVWGPISGRMIYAGIRITIE